MNKIHGGVLGNVSSNEGAHRHNNNRIQQSNNRGQLLIVRRGGDQLGTTHRLSIVLDQSKNPMTGGVWEV